MSGPEFWFHPAAINKAVLAARWYRERSPVTAERFVAEVNRVLDRILEAPTRWPRGFGGTRKIKMIERRVDGLSVLTTVLLFYKREEKIGVFVASFFLGEMMSAETGLLVNREETALAA